MKIETLGDHAGFQPTDHQRRRTPIYQRVLRFTTLNTGRPRPEGPGTLHSHHETTGVLEKRVAAMEAHRAASPGSGMAAVTYSIFTICESGDNIVTPDALRRHLQLFAHTLPQLGINVRFVAPTTSRAWRATSTRAPRRVLRVHRQPAGNVPTGRDRDMAHAPASRSSSTTRADALLCRPFEWGCDIVLHALTK